MGKPIFIFKGFKSLTKCKSGQTETFACTLNQIQYCLNCRWQNTSDLAICGDVPTVPWRQNRDPMVLVVQLSDLRIQCQVLCLPTCLFKGSLQCILGTTLYVIYTSSYSAQYKNSLVSCLYLAFSPHVHMSSK